MKIIIISNNSTYDKSIYLYKSNQAVTLAKNSMIKFETAKAEEALYYQGIKDAGLEVAVYNNDTTVTAISSKRDFYRFCYECSCW